MSNIGKVQYATCRNCHQPKYLPVLCHGCLCLVIYTKKNSINTIYDKHCIQMKDSSEVNAAFSYCVFALLIIHAICQLGCSLSIFKIPIQLPSNLRMKIYVRQSLNPYLQT